MPRDKNNKKITSLLYLIVPLLLLVVYIVVLGFFGADIYGPLDPLFLLNIAVAFGLIIIAEIYIFYTRIYPKLSEVDKLEQLLSDQEWGGKLLIRRDLELTKANDKLRELDQRKSEFVSTVAHQLRTPLSGIKWMLHMLINDEFGKMTDEQKAFLMKGYESNERLVALVEDMLNVDHIESGKSRYIFEETSIFDILDSVLEEARPTIIKKHITVEVTNRTADVPRIMADKEKMRAVLQNLLDNAVKYTPREGTITITALREGDLVRVAFKDSGIGIPEDQKKNIFNRFFRARNALKVETDGTGLGLYIVRNIIEKHGGTVWFESVEGKGTTFYFTLKVVK